MIAADVDRAALETKVKQGARRRNGASKSVSILARKQ